MSSYKLSLFCIAFKMIRNSDSECVFVESKWRMCIGSSLKKKKELNSKQVALITHRIDRGEFSPHEVYHRFAAKDFCFVQCVF